MTNPVTAAPELHRHAALIGRFYAALARRDWAAMAACYHAEIHFSDEAFDVQGADAGLMWRMLCTRGQDMRVVWTAIEAGDHSGSARWVADYTFSATRRPVNNVIDSQFTFRDGLIVRQIDRFDFWRWSRQALGAPGWLFGWSGALRRKVRQNAAKGLAGFAGQVRNS